MSLGKVTFIKSVKVHHYGLHAACCHTTTQSIKTYFYRFNKCDIS